MDYGDDYGFKPYVSVGARRAQAAREMAKLQKKGRRMFGAGHFQTSSRD